MSEATLLAVITHYGVPMVALMLFAGELGIPTGVPIEVALLLTGSYAVHSLPGLLLTLVLMGLVDLLGTTTLHLAARTGGVSLLTRLLRRPLSSPGSVFDRWHDRLGEHDALVVFVLRLLPMVRMWASVGSGLVCLPIFAFLMGAAPAALLWAGVPLTLGYLLGPQIQTLTGRFLLVSHILFVVLPLLLIAGALFWWLRRGHTPRARLLRGRSVVGLLGALGTLAFLVESTRDLLLHPTGHDRTPLLLPGLAMGLLAGISFVLLLVGAADLQDQRRSARYPPRIPYSLATTLAWLAMVVVAGLVMLGLEWRYPGL